MRIALVHRTFALAGGTERFGIDLARALLEAGDEVHLFGHTLAAPVDGATFHPVQLLPLGRAGKLLSFMAASARALRGAQRGGRAPFDVILGLGRTLHQDVLRVGGGCHRVYLETLEGWRDGTPPPHTRFPLYHRLVLRLERQQMTLTRTRHIIAVSHRVKSELLASYPISPGAITVVHNGVDLERFDPERLRSSRRPTRAALGIPHDAHVVIFVGNGLKRKGYYTLLEAFVRFAHKARALQNTRPLRLLVVGRDALRHARALALLRSRLEGLDARVVLAGFQKTVERFYSASDVLVLPTCYEPFGNVCLEALAMKLPVVTTRLNGVSELLGGELCALLLDSPSDAEAIAERMMGLLDEDRRRRLGEVGRSVAMTRSVGRNGREIRQVLGTVAAARLSFGAGESPVPETLPVEAGLFQSLTSKG